MKRIAAIILSLIFLGLQVMLSTPSSFSVTQTGKCCGCKKHNCCVTRNPPDAHPLPAAPAPTVLQYDVSLLPLTAIAWRLPGAATSFIAAVDSPSFLATNVPLFTRHCSFLI